MIYLIDLFCGAGGVTTGATQAGIEIIACVNHDPKSIKSHATNHPECKHYIEDIRTLDLSELSQMVKSLRVKDPEAVIILWASLECTNYSKAKGGKPRDADSRTLAHHLFRYLDTLNPDMLWIENVSEFMSWGPLDDKGKPISTRNGSDYIKWTNDVQTYGYKFEHKILNAADFGAYQSRVRLFLQFAKPHVPVVWPEPTHSKKPGTGTMFSALKKWMPVKDVLDFSDEGESIFERNKELVEATLARIYAGLVKYIASGDESFIAKYYSGRPAGKVIPVTGPAGTISTAGNQSLIQPKFLIKYNSLNGKTGKTVPPSVNDPAPVISTQGRLSLVQTEFLYKYYGNGDNVSSIEDPSGTVSTKDRFAKVKPVFTGAKYFLDKQYSGDHNHQSIDQPAGTILGNDKHHLVKCEHFIMNTNFNNTVGSINDPLHTITANRKYPYLINPAYGGNLRSVDDPCCTIVARQDKAPLYFVQAESGKLQIAIYETDSEMMIKIKVFMVAFGIKDIKMRMLRIKELLKIQGFPDDYYLSGTQNDQKKQIGNAVEVNQAKVLMQRTSEEIYKKVLAA
ncbi:Dcm Site-specific DNA methylase [uncultured Caudovirales phage]|uniref:DNA (cytosine-5-)-methyltransferase n=1 Tax=uncultured Caudovirales phage TaxID=2100421 RepID=A0A6J5STL4_9CAUD|nr:Dcm Site-specific DNA methylase [uncultured Caudovirales phage]